MAASQADLPSTTGCPHHCTIRRYFANLHLLGRNSYDGNGAEGFNVLAFSYKNDEIKLTRAVKNYDLGNFLGEAGGSLGFFLGASAVTIFHYGRVLLGKVVELVDGKKAKM